MEKYRRITRKDRYQIQKYLAAGKTKNWISDRLGFHRSSIYREIMRGIVTTSLPSNTTRKGHYSALKANRDRLMSLSNRRGILYQGSKIKGWVEDQIRIKISDGWSPEQIAHRLKMEKEITISVEAIYKYLLSCKKRNDELYKYLRRYRGRQRRFKRRNRYWEKQHQRRKSIDERPAEANQRKTTGHFERDLMLGKRGTGAILTIVDRKTQYTILQKVASTFAEEVNSATLIALKNIPIPIRTITNDNGHEFGEFWKLEEKIKAKIYFTHPLCPWERGTVENTIGLMRQYIPKGTPLTKIKNRDIKELESILNSRPRKTLAFKTPHEILTGETQKLIKRRKIKPLPVEYYEQFYA